VCDIISQVRVSISYIPSGNVKVLLSISDVTASPTKIIVNQGSLSALRSNSRAILYFTVLYRVSNIVSNASN